MQINRRSNEKFYYCPICKKRFILYILNIHSISCKIKEKAIQGNMINKATHFRNKSNFSKRNNNITISKSNILNNSSNNLSPSIRSVSNYKCQSPYKTKKSHVLIDSIQDLNISNQEKYNSNAKAQKPFKNPRSYFMNKLQLEINKDESNYKNSKEKMMCYLCNKVLSLLQIGFHYQKCEYHWRMNNTNIDINIIKPELFNFILEKIKNKSVVNKEELNEYHQQIESLQKKVIITACPNCAKSILSNQLNSHLKLCEPVPVRNKGNEPLLDSKKMFQELLEKELNDNQYNTQIIKDKPVKKKQKQKNKIGKYDVESVIKEDEMKRFRNNYEICSNCKRKFLPERLQVHIRGCKI